jgi:RimJ/RimL family protein N-acetyltransferase
VELKGVPGLAACPPLRARLRESPMMSLGPLNETAIEPMREAIRTIGGKDVSVDDVRRRVAESGVWGDHGIEYGVWHGDTLLGVVQAVACPFRDPRDTYEVGILIMDPKQRGQGLGFQALSLLLAHLFDERRALRVWFTTDEDNVAMRRLGEHLGFRLEGILRGGREVQGQLIDEAMYGMTRDDPRSPFAPGDHPA